MEIGKNAIIVIGSGEDIKMELAMARLKEEHPDLIIVTNPEEAKERGLNITVNEKVIPFTPFSYKC